MSNLDSSYHRWCREQAAREAGTGFLSVAAVRGSIAVKSAQALRDLPESIRERVALALVDRWHRRQLDRDQEQVLAAFDPDRFSREEPALQRKPAARKTLRSLLRQGGDALGKETDTGNSFEMRFEYEAPGWKVTTYVDLGGRSRQMEYHQQLWVRGEPAPVPRAMNLMAWLGLASVTTWNVLESGDEEAAVHLLRRLCNEFIQAVPRIVVPDLV